jgi:hypothetical protein
MTDPRYYRLSAYDVSDLTRKTFEAMMRGDYPDWFFAHCPWILASKLMGGGMEWEPDCWYLAGDGGPQAQPVVQNLKEMVKVVKPPVDDGEPIPPEPPPTPPTEDEFRNQAWNKPIETGAIAYNPDLGFPKYAREHNLGAPRNNEWAWRGYTMQGFAMGFVLCLTGQWDQTTWLPW